MNARRFLALGLIVLVLPGCSSWRPAPGSPDPALLPAETRQVRVQLSSGSRLVLHRPTLVADSLRGAESKGYLETKHFDGPPTIVPSSEIVTLETRHSDGGKTAALIVGTLAVLFIGGFFAMGAALEDSWEGSWSGAQSPPARVQR